METPETVSESSSTKSPVVSLLEQLQEMNAKGELQSFIVGFVKTDGGAAVQSTPMNAITLNHLCRLIERRVTRQYDQVMAQTSAPRPSTGAGGVPEVARAAALLPRKVRRAVQERQKNLEKLAKKKQAKAPLAPIIRRTPTSA